MSTGSGLPGVVGLIKSAEGWMEQKADLSQVGMNSSSLSALTQEHSFFLSLDLN